MDFATGYGVFCVVVIVYLVPALVAGHRKHPNAMAITVLNILLGWTFLGWAGALVWACTAIKPAEPA